MGELVLTHSGRIELDEVSALCRRAGAGGDEIVAVGDKAFEVVRNDCASLGHSGRSGDLRPLVEDRSAGGSQWEGVAADGAGLVLVLQEHARDAQPSHVFVLSERLDSLVATIALDVGDGDAKWKRRWRERPNERGEGLALLRDGHLLVIKQKEPKRLIEFGPRGDDAGGLGPDRLPEPGEEFAPTSGDVEYRALASWGIEEGRHPELESLNDVAVAGGRIYVLSRSSQRVARLKPVTDPEADSVEVEASADVPAGVECPEGLLVLDGSTLLIADDQAPGAGKPDNLFRLRWPDRL
jgi:hypothetical protein